MIVVFLHLAWIKRDQILKGFQVVYIVNTMLLVPKLTFLEEIINETSFQKETCHILRRLLINLQPLPRSSNMVFQTLEKIVQQKPVWQRQAL
jgi:hypothetical protein